MHVFFSDSVSNIVYIYITGLKDYRSLLVVRLSRVERFSMGLSLSVWVESESMVSASEISSVDAPSCIDFSTS